MADLSTTKIYGDLTVSNNIKGYRIANLDDISVIYENRSITAGNGLSGGGALSNDLTISMGTPTELTASTTNALTATSHTHSIATATAVGLSNTSVSGAGTSTSLARADHTHAITGFSLDTHNHTLDSLSNVTISSIASGEILKWNGTAWVNNTLAEAGIQPADADLTAIAGLSGTSGLLKKTAANTWTLDTTGYTTNTGTVTSVAVSVPTGLSVSGTPVTTSGTIAISLASGYAIPTTTKQTNWDTAYTNTHTSGSDNQTITSGNGMNFTSGSGNVTITLGTPSTITTSTTNSVSADSHTHALTLPTTMTPSNHNLIDTTKHPVSGLTTGHFLKATGATTYGFAAHGLTYSDVGAAASSHTHSYLSDSTTSTQSGYFGDIYLKDDTNASHYLIITDAEDLTANRTLSLDVDNANRTLRISGDAVISGTNTGDQTVGNATLTLAAGTGVTLSSTPSFTANATTDKTITITNSSPNVTTNISITHNATTVVVNSSDGTDGTINGATSTTAGVVTNADQTWTGVKTFNSAPVSANGYTTGSATMVYNSTSKTIDFVFA